MKATFTSSSLRQVKIKVYVNADRRGLFHGWYHENTTDRNGRQSTNLYGVIEMSDGNASTISETKTVVQLRLKLKKLHLAKEPEQEPIKKAKQTYFKRRTP